MLVPATKRSLLLTLALAGLAGCGGSGGGGGGGGGGTPEVNVFTLNASVNTAGSVAMGVIAQDQIRGIPVMIRNTGTANLNVTGPVTVTPTNCTAVVRDAPPAAVAAGDTGVLVILLTAGTSGNPSVGVSIPSNDPDENPFVFTLTFTLNTTTHALYTTTSTFTNLISSTFPGVATTATVNDPVTTGVGVSQHFHLLDRALFQAHLATGSPPDLFLRGLGSASPRGPLNLTSSITNDGGSFGAVQFTSGDSIVFTYTKGAGENRVFSLTINGATAGPPVEISGSLPTGSPAGVALPGIFVSPRKDLIAFFGDFLTAGTNEIFLVAVGGGPRTRISAPLVSRTITQTSIRWLPDQSGLLYETGDATTLQQRELNLIRLPGTVTRLNGAVPSGRTGVIENTTRIASSATHVFFVSDEQGLAPPKRELYVVSLVGGGISAAVGLNGLAVPGTNGVGEYAINGPGTKVLFTADSGPSGQAELFQSRIADSTPTTTEIVSVVNPRLGVQFDGNLGIVSDTTAWYLNDDLITNRRELFFLDMTNPAPAFTRVVDPTVFTGFGAGTAFGAVLPQPNGRIVFSSDQGSPSGNPKIFSAVLSNTPGTFKLSASRTSYSMITVLGNGVAYEGNNGASPQEVFFNLATGGTEVQIDGPELVSTSGVQTITLFSSSRVFYYFFTNSPNVVDKLFNANTSGTITRNQTDTAGVANAPSLRLGSEPR